MKKITAALIALILVSCYHDNAEELYPNGPCIDPPGITYSSTVTGILTSYRCISCHNATLLSGGVNLDGYANVKAKVDDKGLIRAITHSDGYTPMPYNLPQMSVCDINRISAWIIGGAPDN